jgi:TolB protein
MKSKVLLFIFSILLLSANSANAVLEIEITEGIEGGIPIAVVPFGWDGPPGSKPPQDIASIISADLGRTGRFDLKPQQDFLERPHHGGEVNFENWRILGVETLVVGRVRPVGKGNYVVQFQLFDIYKKASNVPGPISEEYKIKQLAGYNLPSTPKELRRTAHYISDIIYEKLTGEKGVFTTQVAYITASGKGRETSYSLQVADADGFNPFTVLRSNEPIMSPAWSPDGRFLAYVSFESKKPAIYIQEMESGTRQRVSYQKGINGAPSWSPDGRQLALTLSRDGNPEIYIMNIASRSLRRLTRNTAIDTEPVWSPDGRSIVFMSDRSGKPQIYKVSTTGTGRPKRITFEGMYNSRAAFSPDGKSLVLVHGDGRRYSIAVLDLDSGVLRELTDGKLDESPSFAPNGSMVLYATEYRGRGILSAVSIDGRVRQRLVLQESDVREPAWAPFTN